MLGIATVVYNQLPFIKRTIEAVLKNTEPPYRYVLVYNDAPYEGVLEYLKTLDVPVLLNTANVGVTRGYLQGLNWLLSQEPLTHFAKVDDDTVIETKGWNTRMLNAFEAFPKLGVLSANIDSGKQIGVFREAYMDGATLQIYDAPSVGGACTIYPLALFRELGFFNDFGYYGMEDGEFAQRTRQAGYITAYLKDVHCRHLGRTSESDPLYDEWKLLFWHRKTNLEFREWKEGKCQETGKSTT